MQKRLLSNEYGIVFPTDNDGGNSIIERSTTVSSASKPANKSGCTSSKASLSCFPASAQEQKDFKLALQLEHEEIDSQHKIQNSSTCLDPDSSCSSNATNTSEHMDLEFEANAAAALLQLQRKHKDK